MYFSFMLDCISVWLAVLKFFALCDRVIQTTTHLKHLWFSWNPTLRDFVQNRVYTLTSVEKNHMELFIFIVRCDSSCSLFWWWITLLRAGGVWHPQKSAATAKWWSRETSTAFSSHWNTSVQYCNALWAFFFRKCMKNVIQIKVLLSLMCLLYCHFTSFIHFFWSTTTCQFSLKTDLFC